jgi:hypothetical protein
VYKYEDYGKFEIGVIGYPADEWYTADFPQV